MSHLRSLRDRAKEFLKNSSFDKRTLLEFLDKVIEPQEKMLFTAHFDQNGKIDCSCMGSLCEINLVPSEEMLGCKRIRLMFLEEADKEEGFKPKADHFAV